MPIYEYRCNSCSKAFARLRRIGADDGDVRCPSCSSDDVERAVSVFSSATTTTTGFPAPAGGGSCSGFT